MVREAAREGSRVDWLVTIFFALLHACGDEVRPSRMDATKAPAALATTVRDVLVGSAG